MSLLGELRRRNVFGIGAAYIVGAWLLIEAASVLGPSMDLPPLAVNYVTFFAIMGFPIALVMAWAYELTPDGVKPATKANAVPSRDYTTGRKFDFIIIGILSLLVGFLLVDDYLPTDRSTDASGATAISRPGRSPSGM